MKRNQQRQHEERQREEGTPSDKPTAPTAATSSSRYRPPTRDPSPAEIRRICRDEIQPTWTPREWQTRANADPNRRAYVATYWEPPEIAVCEAIANAGQGGDRGHG